MEEARTDGAGPRHLPRLPCGCENVAWSAENPSRHANPPEAMTPSCWLADSACSVDSGQWDFGSYGHSEEKQIYRKSSHRYSRRCLTACGPWPAVLVEESG